MNYEVEIQKINARIDNLQQSFIQAQRNQVPITARADEASNKVPQVDENTNGVAENSGGIFDVAALADENSQAMMELAEIIGEME